MLRRARLTLLAGFNFVSFLQANFVTNLIKNLLWQNIQMSFVVITTDMIMPIISGYFDNGPLSMVQLHFGPNTLSFGLVEVI